MSLRVASWSSRPTYSLRPLIVAWRAVLCVVEGAQREAAKIRFGASARLVKLSARRRNLHASSFFLAPRGCEPRTMMYPTKDKPEMELGATEDAFLSAYKKLPPVSPPSSLVVRSSPCDAPRRPRERSDSLSAPSVPRIVLSQSTDKDAS